MFTSPQLFTVLPLHSIGDWLLGRNPQSAGWRQGVAGPGEACGRMPQRSAWAGRNQPRDGEALKEKPRKPSSRPQLLDQKVRVVGGAE